MNRGQAGEGIGELFQAEGSESMKVQMRLEGRMLWGSGCQGGEMELELGWQGPD